MAPWGRVFGGQVLAQALHAAHRTVVAERQAHSLHAYFLLPGDIHRPIVYQVESMRDGGSFTTRRVVALQKGRPIFFMAASFQTMQPGLEHQIEMPGVPAPDDLPTDSELAERLKSKLPEVYKFYLADRPIEFRPVDHEDFLNQDSKPPYRHVWLRAKGALPHDARLHQEILAYASDYNLLGTATLPHRHEVPIHKMFMASLDHAMYFHRAVRADEWLLYSIDSPSASSGRGFTRGNLFNQSGELVASVVQEGLMREAKPHTR